MQQKLKSPLSTETIESELFFHQTPYAHYQLSVISLPPSHLTHYPSMHHSFAAEYFEQSQKKYFNIKHQRVVL